MNTPTVPLGRKKSEPTSIPKSRTASVAESIPSQPGPDQANRRRIRKLPNVQSVRRYAQVVRQTAKRLSHTVREATADGSLGSTEISRLHIWVTADLVPWAVESVELVDEQAKRQANALIDEVKRLDAELSASIGAPAAEIAEQLRKQGKAIVRILVADN